MSNALVNYYGLVNVTDGNKCLKVAGGGNRLNADVVPCNAYRNYYDGPRYAEGITFWTRSGTQIVNFPKLHREHGTRKNEACSTHYKPNVRVFKNARNRCNNSFPSYFLECLLFNVPDSRFEAAFASTFFRVVQYLVDAKNAGTLANFVCQNGQQTLFGPALHQVDLASGWRIVDDLANLWNRWP